ncbi:MAG: hypothetical protein C0614_13995 [Desulfuromonas sp.]|nr:MAG: hypothetical protein C0614_13995 [Desulfuromonas sp.]
MPLRRILLALALVLFMTGTACAELDVYLNRLTASAEADIGGFRTGLGVHFGASGPEIDLVMSNVKRAGDAALCLWLSNHSKQPLERVMHEYQNTRKQGWGVLAKNLGIKPGSEAFKTLKNGDLGWHPEGTSGKGKGKGSSKNKGHKK